MINFHLLPPDCFVAINEIIKKFFFSYQQPYIKLQHNHATQSSKITIRKSTDKYWKITKWSTIECFGFGKTGTSRQGQIFRPFLSCAIWIRDRRTARFGDRSVRIGQRINHFLTAGPGPTDLSFDPWLHTHQIFHLHSIDYKLN